MIYKTLHKKQKIEQHEPHRKKPMVNSVLRKDKQYTCSTSGISRDTLVKNPLICYEWGKGGIGITTKRIYPWLCVTQISLNGLPSHGGDRKTFEIMLVQF